MKYFAVFALIAMFLGAVLASPVPVPKSAGELESPQAAVLETSDLSSFNDVNSRSIRMLSQEPVHRVRRDEISDYEGYEK